MDQDYSQLIIEGLPLSVLFRLIGWNHLLHRKLLNEVMWKKRVEREIPVLHTSISNYRYYYLMLAPNKEEGNLYEIGSKMPILSGITWYKQIYNFFLIICKGNLEVYRPYEIMSRENVSVLRKILKRGVDRVDVLHIDGRYVVITYNHQGFRSHHIIDPYTLTWVSFKTPFLCGDGLTIANCIIRKIISAQSYPGSEGSYNKVLLITVDNRLVFYDRDRNNRLKIVCTDILNVAHCSVKTYPPKECLILMPDGRIDEWAHIEYGRICVSKRKGEYIKIFKEPTNNIPAVAASLRSKHHYLKTTGKHPKMYITSIRYPIRELIQKHMRDGGIVAFIITIDRLLCTQKTKDRQMVTAEMLPYRNVLSTDGDYCLAKSCTI